MKNYFFLLATALLFLTSCSEENSPSGLYNETSWGNQIDGGGDPQPEAGEQYNEIEENDFINVEDQAISTFSIDADGASYANIRRFLTTHSSLPPQGAVRIEEMINYFPMDYERNYDNPVTLNGEIADCPWTEGNKLLRIGCLLYTSPSPRDQRGSRMPSSA